MKNQKLLGEYTPYYLLKIYRIMRLSLFLMLIAVLQLNAKSTYSQSVSLSFLLKDIPIEEVLDRIEQETEFSFLLLDKRLETNKRVTIQANKSSIEQVLDNIFENTNIRFQIVDRQIILTEKPRNSSMPVITQNVDNQVSGMVTDDNGEPIIGANVVEKGTTNGTITDIQGNFTLEISSDASLVISYIGYKEQIVPVNDEKILIIKLIEDSKALDEIVVVGYGTQKKANLTGAVDKITSNSIDALKVNTMGEALQGQVPNLNVGIADGKPGRSANFNIRGTTSINGGSPLIVIDGVPSSVSDLNNLSPQDVDEISVLKDAASAAIYGARAAYGVILVQTKRAKEGEFNISYTNNFGWGKATWLPDVYMNPVDYMDIIEGEFNANIGQTYFTEAQVNYPRQVANDSSLPFAKVENIGGKSTLLLGGQVHNYYKEWFRKYTPKQNHHLSIKGGSDKIKYYLSGDFNHEEGSLKFKPEKINRYSLRSNIIYDINKYISIYNNTSLLNRKDDLPNTYLYAFCSNVWRFIECTNPLMPEKLEVNGEVVPTDIGFYRNFLTDQSEHTKEQNGVSTTMGIDFAFLNDDLKLHADYTYQFSNWNTLRWWDNKGPYLSHAFNNRNTIQEYYSDAGPAKIYRSTSNTKSWNVNLYATYDKYIKEHHFTLMGGLNRESYDYLYMYGEHQYPLLGIPQHSLNLATGDYKATDDDDRNISQSTFFRLNYDLKSRYLLEINGCYNLSSKFARNNRGAFFGSFSGGWRISEENFFKPLRKYVDNLKIRASYGSLGNQNIGSFDYLPIMDINQSGYMLEGERVSYTSSPNPKSANFTWEKSETIDFGLDLSLLNSRLNFTFDVYQRDTKNMLATFRSLPSVFGATVPKENSASLRNRGWELSLAWSDAVKVNMHNLSYGIRLNLSDYTAEITDYFNTTNYLGNYYIGQKLGEIWGLTTLGFFKTDEEAQNSPLLDTNSYRQYSSAGCIKFDDKNNDGKISKGAWTLDDHGDYEIIGNTTPRYQFGITLNAAYRGFDINAFFKGVGKRDIYPATESVNFWGPYNRKYQVLLQHIVEDRWTPDNPDAYFPKPQGYIAASTNSDLGVPQTRYMQNAAYLRLKNIAIGYTLPKQITQKAKINHLRVFISGQNLFEFTNLHKSLDPEGLEKDPDANTGSIGMGTSYPIQRAFSFGIEVQL